MFLFVLGRQKFGKCHLHLTFWIPIQWARQIQTWSSISLDKPWEFPCSHASMAGIVSMMHYTLSFQGFGIIGLCHACLSNFPPSTLIFYSTLKLWPGMNGFHIRNLPVRTPKKRIIILPPLDKNRNAFLIFTMTCVLDSSLQLTTRRPMSKKGIHRVTKPGHMARRLRALCWVDKVDPSLARDVEGEAAGNKSQEASVNLFYSYESEEVFIRKFNSYLLQLKTIQPRVGFKELFVWNRPKVSWQHISALYSTQKHIILSKLSPCGNPIWSRVQWGP